MFIRYPLVLLAAILMIQPVFADDDMSSDSKPCKAIVKSCLDGGYTRQKSEGKKFWKDCMKPLVLGQSVKGVSVKAEDVKACRAAKIKKLEQELNEMKAVQ
ncbi:MAG: hypothetical protein KIT56_09940 [Gammaproteobacteria bacterium]|nr:hypothetical protein [Gammaproteobacteria bacterium]MCW5584170.1 hypothetical protein [Gammaproteobacteria bacterium]